MMKLLLNERMMLSAPTSTILKVVEVFQPLSVITKCYGSGDRRTLVVMEQTISVTVDTLQELLEAIHSASYRPVCLQYSGQGLDFELKHLFQGK